jgi:hypothetical protein
MADRLADAYNLIEAVLDKGEIDDTSRDTLEEAKRALMDVALTHLSLAEAGPYNDPSCPPDTMAGGYHG